MTICHEKLKPLKQKKLRNRTGLAKPIGKGVVLEEGEGDGLPMKDNGDKGKKDGEKDY